MNDLIPVVDISIKGIALLGALVGGWIAYRQLNETRRKRNIDMYWKFAEIYMSEKQFDAKYAAHQIRENYFPKLISQGLDEKTLIECYNKDYHLIDRESEENKAKKKIDILIMDRIRYLNQVGVILKRNLIDKDLIFGLIGVGLDLDYDSLKVVLDAHRLGHDFPNMYIDMEITWREYQTWKLRKDDYE